MNYQIHNPKFPMSGFLEATKKGRLGLVPGTWRSGGCSRRARTFASLRWIWIHRGTGAGLLAAGLEAATADCRAWRARRQYEAAATGVRLRPACLARPNWGTLSGRLLTGPALDQKECATAAQDASTQRSASPSRRKQRRASVAIAVPRPSAPTPAESRGWGYGARPRGPRTAALARPSGGSASVWALSSVDW
jgi:hypothetical protein